MSLQDDVFDIDHALTEEASIAERKMGRESWDIFCKWAWNLEEVAEKLQKENRLLRGVITLKDEESPEGKACLEFYNEEKET